MLKAELSAPEPVAVVIYGPSGCGKTENANRLAKAYGKSRVVDDWVPGSKLDCDTLALTAFPFQTAVPFSQAAVFAGLKLPKAAATSIADACAFLGAS